MKKLFLAILTLSICGCGHSARQMNAPYRNVGHLIGIRLVQRGDFGEVISEVKTDQGTFPVYGYVTVGRLSDPVLISNNGYLYVPGNKPLDLVDWHGE